ncbi:Hybrid signal transduction histidine kinase B [Diplodia seriata]|uniref:histidine kinase n=1 Tax=Diplodia seriata TaxID=420778 RepID=A0A1S8B8Z0_9PEZI|nr:Hybrid signal transduction histidine kinase B [Diplodia seriata]
MASERHALRTLRRQADPLPYRQRLLAGNALACFLSLTAAQPEVLSAFAQLGTHRLNAKRAFISLIDSQSQFVLAEATQTVPLGNPSCAESADPLWLGCAVIPRAFGTCQCALQSDVLVINDLQQDRRFTDLPFAATAPNFRFYAGVPLMSPQGVAIGVYCIIDDVPRHGLGQDELLFMQDMAAAVVSYLRAARAQDTNRKAEQMIRGLNSFVTGAADLQARDDLNVPRNPATGSPTGSHTSRHDTTEASPSGNEARDDLLSPGTERMFSRAAHIMRQSSDLDGVIFFDASLAAPDGPSEPVTDEDDDASTHRSAATAEESSGSTASSYGYPRLPTCKILGFADAARSSRHGGAARKDYLGLTETSLRRLLKRHPNGKIFNIARETVDNTPMKHTRRGRLRRSTAVEAIVDIASNARSAAIMPLWDHERQRWFAGCLCWTSDPNRQLSHGSDLLYLRAFGNSIMTELGRLDTVAVNRAKASFIESMSHELRSPLHGILGGVEYLLEMRLDAFQTSIVNSISMCGRTLLDTVQNVLEYSRINEYTGPSARPSLPGCLRATRASLSLMSTDPPTNIRRLTEETVEAVFSGQSYNVGSPPSATEDDPFFPEYTSPSSPSPVPPTSRKAVRVILDLPVGPCWTYAVQPGVWRRILMNVFGNALRFTDAGFVRVSLSATDINDSQSRITLTVADSGCGMTLRFLQDGLFEAFSQENSFSSGTGLGMSIVQRLVRSVGGDISVQTKVGTGTVVKIHMVLHKCEETMDDFALAVAAQTKDMNIAVARTIIPNDDETQKLSCDAEVQFHASLTDTLQTWFGIKVTHLDDVNTDGSQLVMYPGPSFNSMFKNRARQGVSIVVAMDGMEAATLRSDSRVTSGWIDVVTQP